MINKRGFVLLETVIVLLVAVICMLGLFLTYSFLIKNLDQAKHYDNINDVYKLNIFYKVMKENGFPSDDFIKINNDNNCIQYFDANCQSLMTELNIEYILYINKDIDSILVNPLNLTNTDINYLKRLEHNYSYLIGVYQKNDEYYYVYLKVGEL